jgi:hypothetical protein
MGAAHTRPYFFEPLSTPKKDTREQRSSGGAPSAWNRKSQNLIRASRRSPALNPYIQDIFQRRLSVLCGSCTNRDPPFESRFAMGGEAEGKLLRQ